MKLRTEPYTPDISSQPYRVGDRSVRLLAGIIADILPFTRRLEQVLAELEEDPNPESIRRREAEPLATAVWLRLLWDDPDVEWHTPADDLDELVLTGGAALIERARQLRLELNGGTVRKLGIDASRLADVLWRAAAGLGDEQPDGAAAAPGEA